MKRNYIVSLGEAYYHPEDHPAPLKWRRVTGERVELPELSGLWCRIEKNQSPFLFSTSRDGYEIVIREGFTNSDLNGKTLSASLLAQASLASVEQDDEMLLELKAGMKEAGLPSCTRLNLCHDYRMWAWGWD